MFFLIITENCTILKYVCLNVHCLQKFVKLSLVHERVTFTCIYICVCVFVCVCLCVLRLDLCIVTVIQIYSAQACSLPQVVKHLIVFRMMPSVNLAQNTYSEIFRDFFLSPTS
jgi:hypothetical protein